MNNFISQNKSAFKKKKNRWKPKGRQLEKEIFAEIQSLFVGKTIARDELIEYLHLIQTLEGIHLLLQFMSLLRLMILLKLKSLIKI